MAVANVYEIFNLFNSSINKEIRNECLRKNFINLMKVLIPFTPHLAHECLEEMNEKDMSTWPKIDKKSIAKQKIKVAVQINGRTKDVVQVEKDLTENEFIKEIKKFDKLSNLLKNKEINKIIYVKNKIINFLIK